MSEAFKVHIESLEPGSPQAEKLRVAASSAEALLAYSQANGLDLTREDAEGIAAVAANGPLNDGDLDAVSGGGGFFRSIWMTLEDVLTPHTTRPASNRKDRP